MVFSDTPLQFYTKVGSGQCAEETGESHSPYYTRERKIKSGIYKRVNGLIKGCACIAPGVAQKKK